ncbi:MAG: ComF family protein [Paludibacteraceae bacterium]|nr:ComF family protein [Paludibacteraceae bacterium]
MSILRDLFAAVYHIINPRTCVMCGKVLLFDEDCICTHCLQSQLPRTEQANHRDNVLEQLLENDKLHRAAAYCFYLPNHPFRHAIRAAKFHYLPEINYLLAKQAANEWKQTGFFDDIDCIVPVPLHKKRLRQRTYNQSLYIARGLAEVTGLPVDTTHLVRTINNEQQSHKSIADREQLPQIFAVVHGEDLRNKHVLLVDDVITSGSTMQRAMMALHPIRNCTFSVFTLALAHMHAHVHEVEDGIFL